VNTVALLDAFLDEVAERVALRLNSRVEHAVYSSQQLPPRCSRRRFAEVCRSGRVRGARRDGRDWVCTREAWEGRRSGQRAPWRPTMALDARAEVLLRRAGLRVASRAREG
jgi:hypothetical protein